MARIVVVGAGMMGSALTVPLADRGHDVRLIGSPLDDAIIATLRQGSPHPKLDVALPAGVSPFPCSELPNAFEGADAVALGVSSPGIDWASGAISDLVKPSMPVFMITKGLVWDGAKLVTLPDVVERRLGASRGDFSPAAVAGPCIAGELARRAPTCVVLTGRHGPTLDEIARMISTPYYHVMTSVDLKGNEVCAALKNVYAMGIALAVGLHEKAGGRPGSIALHNLESAMFAESVREMRSLVAIVGGDPDTASGLAGVGDIDVTTNGGRTGRFGRLLGLGIGRAKAIEAMEGATLECLETLEVLEQAITAWGEEGALKKSAFPLLLHLVDVALHDAEVKIPLERFFRS